MTHFMYLTNHFRGHYFECVTDLTLYDTRPFEYDFFEWIPRRFLLLKYLNVNNLTPQKKKCQIESANDQQISSKFSYFYLIRLRLPDAHIDYAVQFLRDKNAYVSHLHKLTIQYEQLGSISKLLPAGRSAVQNSKIHEIIFHVTCPRLCTYTKSLSNIHNDMLKVLRKPIQTSIAK